MIGCRDVGTKKTAEAVLIALISKIVVVDRARYCVSP